MAGRFYAQFSSHGSLVYLWLKSRVRCWFWVTGWFWANLGMNWRTVRCFGHMFLMDSCGWSATRSEWSYSCFESLKVQGLELKPRTGWFKMQEVHWNPGEICEDSEGGTINLEPTISNWNSTVDASEALVQQEYHNEIGRIKACHLKIPIFFLTGATTSISRTHVTSAFGSSCFFRCVLLLQWVPEGAKC